MSFRSWSLAFAHLYTEYYQSVVSPQATLLVAWLRSNAMVEHPVLRSIRELGYDSLGNRRVWCDGRLCDARIIL